ncbi:uncharacterized protein B0T23DRAFT_180503 [Neurospora hispaniola]|uniref:Ankyrin n=1 Tax=Neurospora hispaniola TaxID=588809 RepID=A0AAJ0I6R4_9PEZI|nr:hypothetical protein B0T23DRAFT_180503 [Neurospora hispaniola]
MSSLGNSSSKASPRGTRIGRPPQWTVSRSRKLARLYVYTTLSIGRIIKVLEDDLFAPRKNSAQKTVHKMLDHDPRRLRPESRVEMDQRIDSLSKSTIRKRTPDNGIGRPHPNEVQRRISDCSTLYAEKVRTLLDNFTIASGSDLEDIQRHSWLAESCEFPVTDIGAVGVSPTPGYAVPGDFLTAHTLNCAELPASGHGSGTCWCAIVAETTREEGSWLIPTGKIRDKVSDLVRNPSPEVCQLHDPFRNTLLHLFSATSGCQAQLFRLLPYAGNALGFTNTANQTFLHVLSPEWFTNVPSASSSLRRLLDVVRPSNPDIFHVTDVYGRTFFHRAASLVADREVLTDILAYCNIAIPLSRDAFGFDPVVNVQPDPTVLQSESTIQGNPISYTPHQLPIGSSMPSRVPSPSVSVSGIPSGADEGPFLTYHARLIRIIHSAYPNSLVEDTEGRNGLHCLAEAIINQQSMDKQRSALSITSSSRPHRRSTHSSLASELIPIHVIQSTGHTSHPSPVTSTFGIVTEHENPLPSRLRHLRSLLHPSSEHSAVGVNPNAYDKSGCTPLMAFIQHIPDHEDDKSCTLQTILETLIRGGASIEARNRRGETPLLMAARLGRKIALSVLLEQGANMRAKDRWGRGVLEILDWGVLDCNGSASKTQEESLTGREKGIKEREELALYARLEACRGLLTRRRDWVVGYVSEKEEYGMGVVGEWRVQGRLETDAEEREVCM